MLQVIVASLCLSLHSDLEKERPGLVWWLCSIEFSATPLEYGPQLLGSQMVAGILAISIQQQDAEKDKEERGQRAYARYILMEFSKHFKK